MLAAPPAQRNAYQRIVTTSRLPQLPRDTYRIIVRPRNGLDVTKVSQIPFEQALAMAAALAPAEIEEDTICPNGTQNIYVVCTSHKKNACAYVKAQQVRLGDFTYLVSVYPAPPDDTCKGVTRGVDCGRGRSVTPAAQRRKSRARSRGRSVSGRRFQEELTWADRVKEKTPKPIKVMWSASPEHGEKSEIEQLRQDIASLKAELRKKKAA
ncbi:hypothetical protein HPB51_001945 [Rhipicephalus microplus]|uniref:Uncharacterized protein n=1 Tax=Rhipicephalus microplus TaxID=6941 RepID=A0A9J6DYV9_RHIMP|nr:hypothetical protein HPB51_001945 [Rhipicephalus microplus]